MSVVEKASFPQNVKVEVKVMKEGKVVEHTVREVT